MCAFCNPLNKKITVCLIFATWFLLFSVVFFEQLGWTHDNSDSDEEALAAFIKMLYACEKIDKNVKLSSHVKFHPHAAKIYARDSVQLPQSQHPYFISSAFLNIAGYANHSFLQVSPVLRI
ncbi:MAG: hypothetical protein NTX71_08605 [Candidatus Aureabacteria bacterium]|nr:hypothetical protein [Candidatus Auribacterota bacterium]